MAARKLTKTQEADLMRRILVGYVTVQCFLLLIFFTIAPYLIGKLSPEESWSVIQILLPVFTGYIGQIVGFYFGMQDQK